MQKICALVLLTVLVSNCEALPQPKWTKQLRNLQGQLTRERRQFPFGEWIPLNQPCPTCRPVADPLDSGLRSENIGLTPPRPPPVTRQIHGEGNFFPQDESSILSVPPPPPSATRLQPPSPTGNFQNLQFPNFAQQFNNPLPVPTQQIFPQTQQLQFLPQSFLPNQHLLVNNDPQILPALNNPNALFGQENKGKQQVNNGKVTKFNSDFKQQKLPENVVLEQNRRPAAPQPPATRLEVPFSNKPTPFAPPPPQQHQQQSLVQHNQQQTFNQQQQQQSFTQQQQQQQPLLHQQQNSIKFGDSFLTPPPAPNTTAQDIVIPGLNKEEIQLLYVPVETLRQRGNFQEQLLTQQLHGTQFQNRPSVSQHSSSSLRPTEPSTTKQPKGHFVTQNGNSQGQSLSTLKVTSAQPFPTTITPSSLLLQQFPFHQTPQPFVSATPPTPTIQPFVTPSTKFSPFTPETTLSHLVTIPNSIHFGQSNVEFGTTPKTILSQDAFQGDIINGKPQFTTFKDTTFQNQFLHHQQRPANEQKQEHLQQQSFLSQQQQSERQPQTSSFQKEQEIQNQLSKQQLADQQEIALKKQQEQQRLLQQQKEKDLQEQYLLKQRQQKELEAQRQLQQQRQKELEEQRFLQQQRQKELEEQRYLQQQRQKELEEQRFLQQQRQKELDEQRFLQQQRQKELEEQQRFLQQQRQKELENQRRLQQQRQKELEDQKRRLQQQKQREQEEQRFLLLQQQQQKELEEQRLLQQQQQEQQRLLHQQKLQRQKQENLNKQQQFEFVQHQQTPQQQPQQVTQQPNRHILPENDKLNFISQLEKESEPETNQNLVPHQPPLSVFFRGYNGADARIVDVLRELRSSNTITVLDQYFEKMPKVFVGPAGLIPPTGYGKFELPYLSNLETNRIERKIDRLPFFVAPLNFVPPPGYSKIPFPAPHIGSVVVSSENNPAMKSVSAEKENVGAVAEDEASGSYPVVGPEIPGLINGLETETTTIKPTFPSTPSLPQTTAQLRNRRPNSNLYRPQSRKPISKTRPQTTSKPEEEVTQQIQKTEDPDSGLRKPINRFLKRRRPQVKTTTETLPKEQKEGKNLENRHYSVEVYHQQKNTNLPKHQEKNGFFEQNQNRDHRGSAHFEHQSSNIDRTTPDGQRVFEVQPTPGFFNVQPTAQAAVEDHRSDNSEYSDVNNLQSFEDGPVPTGSAKTITQQLYRPNDLRITDQRPSVVSLPSKIQPKLDSTQSAEKFTEAPETGKYAEVYAASTTAVSVDATLQQDRTSEGVINIHPTPGFGPIVTSERYYEAEYQNSENSHTPNSVTASGEQQTTGQGISDEYTSAFAEISKHHHIPRPTESSSRQHSKFSDGSSTSEIAQHLQAPFSESFSQGPHYQEFATVTDTKPTESAADFSKNNYVPTGSANIQYTTGFSNVHKNGHTFGFSLIPQEQVSPTAPAAVAKEQYSTDYSANSNTQNFGGSAEEHQTNSFAGFQGFQSTPDAPVSQASYFPSSTETSFQEQVKITEGNKEDEYPKIVEANYVSATPETVAAVSDNPSTQHFKSESISENPDANQKQSIESQGQTVGDNLSEIQRPKFPNPSIVRVRTRGRSKARGQVNFAASQSTTLSPITRGRPENRPFDNSEQEYTTRSSNTRDYQSVKISKYNQYRGVKKASRPTTEASTEHEPKVNVYTIRPQKRPANPSTVSTKRIRKPTTPLPTVESATESFSLSTAGAYTPAEESEFPPSGVSNDVYFDHTSLSPIRQKFRKHFGTSQQKTDVLTSFGPTAFPSTVQTHPSTVQIDHSEEVSSEKDLTHALLVPQENSEKYSDWNPSESSIDVSGIVLTTTANPSHEDEHEVEQLKKSQDSKKAFDPDLEKKSGRRRVRVRVHKRPHENFETAESQNLRTVANVLVPPTSTYKPIDETNIHQLAKNSDFSFGGQKSFGLRSREYFRKRLNLTEDIDSKQASVEVNKEAQPESEQTTKTKENAQEEVQAFAGVEARERLPGSRTRTYIRKIEKVPKKEHEDVAAQTTESKTSGNEGNKHVRTKYRGYVRKIVKQESANREEDSETSNPAAENGESEVKHEKLESHSREQFKVNYAGHNQTGRFNGTRHRTFVRYVKKNRIRTQQETESHQEPEQHQKEEQEVQQVTEAQRTLPEQEQTPESETLKAQQIEIQKTTEAIRTQYPVYHSTQQPELPQTQRSDQVQTKESEERFVETTKAQPTQQALRQTTEEPEFDQVLEDLFRTSHDSKSQEQTEKTETSQSRETGLNRTQRPRGYQTLRPIYQRTQNYERQRKTESTSAPSTTEHVTQGFHEKRIGSGRPKYGRTSGYGATGSEKTEEAKKAEISDQQTKNKNLHLLEVRKYLRNKSREGGFSQFSKNRHFTSEKTEIVSTVATTKNSETFEESKSEEFTTPVEKTTETKNEPTEEANTSTKTEFISTESEPKTTQVFVTSTDAIDLQTDTTRDYEETKLPTTTETVENFTEEESTEYDVEDFTTSVLPQTTTEAQTEETTTSYQTLSSETVENFTEPKPEEETTSEEQQSETQPDLYRFSKNSFSFDEAEKFAGTKNRAHVRNITADIIENTASFSAPGVEKHPEIHVIPLSGEENLQATTESLSDVTINEKTEETTTERRETSDSGETSTETEQTTTTDAVTKPKTAKLIKTSTTTKISHETEICYKGKCIRTKSENPDEDLKLLVDSASTMKIEKTKT